MKGKMFLHHLTVANLPLSLDYTTNKMCNPHPQVYGNPKMLTYIFHWKFPENITFSVARVQNTRNSKKKVLTIFGTRHGTCHFSPFLIYVTMETVFSFLFFSFFCLSFLWQFMNSNILKAKLKPEIPQTSD